MIAIDALMHIDGLSGVIAFVSYYPTSVDIGCDV
jgi:hypothetical protein